MKRTVLFMIVSALLAILVGCSQDNESEGCHTDMECKGDRVCEQGSCVDPGGSTGSTGSGASEPTVSDCIQTTYQVTTGMSSGESTRLYTGTSWKLEGCTELQPDPSTITIRCARDSTGNAKIISEGCALFGIAAPGNITNDKGPEGDCDGRTITDTTIMCSQTCTRPLDFTITSGPCD